MTINEIAFIILKETYDKMMSEEFGASVSLSEIIKKHSLKEELSQTALIYLERKKLVKAFDDDIIALTPDGVDSYELREQPNTPLYLMNQYVINAGGDISTGGIQQGSNNIMNKLTYEQIFQKIEEEIIKSDLKNEQKKTLLTKLKEFTSHPLIVEFLKRLIFGQLQV